MQIALRARTKRGIGRMRRTETLGGLRTTSSSGCDAMEWRVRLFKYATLNVDTLVAIVGNMRLEGPQLDT
ncbi:hypothetical protein Q1695_013156 [Nippostrongylus brasiliensis]|nr:hypothetical protein Q1695_013156 [Nippostrongylus brasiliensis]